MSRKGLIRLVPFSDSDREFLPKIKQPKVLGSSQPQRRAPPLRNATTRRSDSNAQPFVHFPEFDSAEVPLDPDPVVNHNLTTARSLLENRGTGARTVSQAEALDNNWNRLRPELTKSYVSNYPVAASLLQKRLQAVQNVFRDQCKQEDVCECPHCSANGEDSRTAIGDMQVLVVSLDQRFLLQVPRYKCSQCRIEYSLKPTQLGCLPATPVEAWDLCAAGPQQVTWVDMQLAQFCDLMAVVQKRVSLLSLVETMNAMHSRNQCPSPLNTDTFRRQLSSVVLEYGYLLCHTRDMVAMGVENFPAGPLSQCGGCWEVSQQPEDGQPPRELHSALIDFNFKVGLLESVAAKAANLHSKPPNQKFFLDDKDVREFANLPSSSVSPDPDKACADFHADKVSFARHADPRQRFNRGLPQMCLELCFSFRSSTAALLLLQHTTVV